jgi:hypothetical protein
MQRIKAEYRTRCLRRKLNDNSRIPNTKSRKFKVEMLWYKQNNIVCDMCVQLDCVGGEHTLYVIFSLVRFINDTKINREEGSPTTGKGTEQLRRMKKEIKEIDK